MSEPTNPPTKPWSAYDIYNMLLEHVRKKKTALIPVSTEIENRFGKALVEKLNQAFENDLVSDIDDILINPDTQIKCVRDFLLASGIAEENPESPRLPLGLRPVDPLPEFCYKGDQAQFAPEHK